MAGLQQELASTKQALLAASGQLPILGPKAGHSTSFWVATGVLTLLACAGMLRHLQPCLHSQRAL